MVKLRSDVLVSVLGPRPPHGTESPRGLRPLAPNLFEVSIKIGVTLFSLKLTTYFNLKLLMKFIAESHCLMLIWTGF